MKTLCGGRKGVNIKIIFLFSTQKCRKFKETGSILNYVFFQKLHSNENKICRNSKIQNYLLFLLHIKYKPAYFNQLILAASAKISWQIS